MAPEAEPADIEQVVTTVESVGAEAFVSRGVTEMFDRTTGSARARVSRVVIGLVGDFDLLSGLNLAEMRGVSRVARVSSPYKLVSREHHVNRSTVKVAGVSIGPD
ncbi:MAG TPA: hypothetical protein VFO68_13900, partial [Actinophytocola sp.]|nr:hypothetical protein [Actinophytocola sp.]